MFVIRDVIELAIQIEKNAEKIYRSAQSKLTNSSLISTLQWLAEEEVNHAKWFSKLKEKINPNLSDPAIEEMGRTLLADALGSQSFSLREANFSEIQNLEELLTLAAEFERDKVMFYEMLRPFIEDPETLTFLEKIISEENRHIQRLMSLKENNAEEDVISPERL